MANSLIPPVGAVVRLSEYPTRKTGGISKAEGNVELARFQQRLDELQDIFIADGRFALLMIFQAIDAGGKDGTIRSVFTEVDPLGVRAIGFKAPTDDELAHDFLWRVHAQVPGKGQMAIFNRSHYEDVLVARVKGLVPQPVWRRRYDHINAFEKMLVDEGTTILKFFLHVSKEEQRLRLQERVDMPHKRWKFRKGDLEDRERWDDYQSAFEDALTQCNTDYAPWHIVPADQNWFRNLTVARTIVKTLEGFGLRYPEAAEWIEGLKVV